MTCSAFGINTPLFYLAHHLADNVKDKVLTLHIYLGCAWMLGCSIFGLLVVKKSVDCRIAKQYLCQAAILICGLAMLMLTTVEGNYQTYLFFVWVYGKLKNRKFQIEKSFYCENIFRCFRRWLPLFSEDVNIRKGSC